MTISCYTKNMFQKFLSTAWPVNIPESEVDISKYFGIQLPGADAFTNKKDTLFFAGMISHALEKIPVTGNPLTIIDLGAGSSLPTIKALRDNPHQAVKVIAVDIDSECLAISRRNVKYFGLMDRYNFVRMDILEVLRTQKLDAETFVVSNPPFIPIPAGFNDPHFLRANGGIDGTKYIDAILNAPRTPGSYVAVQWSSLTNPEKIIPIIEKKFDVLDTRTTEVAFGPYTKALRPYLQEQSSLGLASFNEKDAANPRYTVVGTFLRSRPAAYTL